MNNVRRQRQEPDEIEAASDPFSDIETERLAQEIARLYVLLAESLGAR